VPNLRKRFTVVGAGAVPAEPLKTSRFLKAALAPIFMDAKSNGRNLRSRERFLAVYETRGADTAITIVMLWRLRAVNGEREWRRAHKPQRLPFTRQALKTFHG
jgi:hypothetical protein